jgi:hypothetical protein
MVIKKGSRNIAAIATLLTLLSVVYASSCSKSSFNKYSCSGVVCLNGGYCDSGLCVCPVGFEGANCSIPYTAKYLGTWDVRQVIIGTDSVKYLHDTAYYQAFLKATATPTTFFFDNFAGDPYYNQVVCIIDTIIKGASSDNTNNFVIDTTSGYSMRYGHYMLQWGYGSINDTTINATYSVRFTNNTSNYEHDTVSITLTPHHL